MPLKPIPRQRPYCTYDDFADFFRLALAGNLKRGPFVERFEHNFAAEFNAKYAITASSCRSVFSVLIDGLGIKEGDEVILPAYNLGAFAKILKYKKIKPVFADIEEDTLVIDPKKIESLITDRTRAIVAVHLFGNVCDMHAIMNLAGQHQLYVIEDCANAYGTHLKGELLGTFGDAACFSLSHSKDIPTFGGGIAVIKDENTFKKMSSVIKTEFNFPSYVSIMKMFVKNFVFKLLTSPIGYAMCVFPVVYMCAKRDIDFIANCIEDDDQMISGINKTAYANIQAYIGLKKLKQNNRIQRQRRLIAQEINEVVRNIKSIRTPASHSQAEHAYWNYILISDKREELIHHFNDFGIDVKRITAYNNNQFELFKDVRQNCPVTDRIDKKTLALPLYHLLSEAEVQHIINALLAWKEKNG